MTTDNRTNEPTEAQVEAAAVASINSHRSRAGLPTLAALDGVPNADEWRADARAALEAAARAAQGAAPQAECDCGAGPGSAVCKKVCATRAPVLPSSGVDEDNLAEVLRSYLPMGEDPALDATAKAQARAVAEWLMITGYTDDELDELGGFEEEKK